jgi:hypothetical protein
VAVVAVIEVVVVAPAVCYLELRLYLQVYHILLLWVQVAMVGLHRAILQMDQIQQYNMQVAQLPA